MLLNGCVQVVISAFKPVPSAMDVINMETVDMDMIALMAQTKTELTVVQRVNIHKNIPLRYVTLVLNLVGMINGKIHNGSAEAVNVLRNVIIAMDLKQMEMLFGSLHALMGPMKS